LDSTNDCFWFLSTFLDYIRLSRSSLGTLATLMSVATESWSNKRRVTIRSLLIFSIEVLMTACWSAGSGMSSPVVALGYMIRNITNQLLETEKKNWNVLVPSDFKGKRKAGTGKENRYIRQKIWVKLIKDGFSRR
jgi:hypothetical protein